MPISIYQHSLAVPSFLFPNNLVANSLLFPKYLFARLGLYVDYSLIPTSLMWVGTVTTPFYRWGEWGMVTRPLVRPGSSPCPCTLLMPLPLLLPHPNCTQCLLYSSDITCSGGFPHLRQSTLNSHSQTLHRSCIAFSCRRKCFFWVVSCLAGRSCGHMPMPKSSTENEASIIGWGQSSFIPLDWRWVLPFF